MIISVPISVRSPHRVKIIGGAHGYFKRVDASTPPMTHHDLEEAFMREEKWMKEADRSHNERIESFITGETGPLALSTPFLIVEVTPFGKRDVQINFKEDSNITKLNQIIYEIERITPTTYAPTYNKTAQTCFEGRYYRSDHSKFPYHILMKRNGAVEFASTCLLLEGGENQGIWLCSLKEILIDSLSGILPFLIEEKIFPPLLLRCSLIGVKNLRISRKGFINGIDNSIPLTRDKYFLPPVLLDEIDKLADMQSVKSYLYELLSTQFEMILDDVSFKL